MREREGREIQRENEREGVVYLFSISCMLYYSAYSWNVNELKFCVVL